MKKIFSLLILALMFANTQAQFVKKIPADLNPKRLITAKLNIKTGYEHATLNCQVVYTEGKGETLKFKSSVNIARAQISFIGVDNSAQIIPYNANTKESYFYLESGAYKGGLKNGYTLNFYVGKNIRPVWTFIIGPKN